MKHFHCLLWASLLVAFAFAMSEAGSRRPGARPPIGTPPGAVSRPSTNTNYHMSGLIPGNTITVGSAIPSQTTSPVPGSRPERVEKQPTAPKHLIGDPPIPGSLNDLSAYRESGTNSGGLRRPGARPAIAPRPITTPKHLIGDPPAPPVPDGTLIGSFYAVEIAAGDQTGAWSPSEVITWNGITWGFLPRHSLTADPQRDVRESSWVDPTTGIARHTTFYGPETGTNANVLLRPGGGAFVSWIGTVGENQSLIIYQLFKKPEHTVQFVVEPTQASMGPALTPDQERRAWIRYHIENNRKYFPPNAFTTEQSLEQMWGSRYDEMIREANEGPSPFAKYFGDVANELGPRLRDAAMDEAGNWVFGKVTRDRDGLISASNEGAGFKLLQAMEKTIKTHDPEPLITNYITFALKIANGLETGMYKLPPQLKAIKITFKILLDGKVVKTVFAPVADATRTGSRVGGGLIQF